VTSRVREKGIRVKKKDSSTRRSGRKSGKMADIVGRNRVEWWVSFLKQSCGIEGFWKTG
jgi:hypothetical protein